VLAIKAFGSDSLLSLITEIDSKLSVIDIAIAAVVEVFNSLSASVTVTLFLY